MKYHIVHLGTDYPGKITDFSEARNSFIEKLPDREYILFLDNDEEAPQMLLDQIAKLAPQHPYYWIRRFNLAEGRYIPLWNPEYNGRLVSNKVRYRGAVHERVFPHRPHGIIDFPIIHNHAGGQSYKNRPWHQLGPVSRGIIVMKKLQEVVRGR